MCMWACGVSWSECRCASECGITSEGQAEEPAGNGSGLRGCVDVPASEEAGMQKLQLV